MLYFFLNKKDVHVNKSKNILFFKQKVWLSEVMSIFSKKNQIIKLIKSKWLKIDVL